MKTITFNQKNSVSGQPTEILESFTIDAEKALTSKSTRSIYVRIGYMNKTPFISQRGNGGSGSGDVCSLTASDTIDVQYSLYERLKVWAEKNDLIIE